MTKRILLVEDDSDLSQLITTYLEKYGYQIQAHTQGDTVQQAIKEFKPDLVVLDIMLPGLDGLEICRTIRPGYQGAVMMMTACNEDMDQILGLELGADDYLIKPVEPRLLLARVRAMFRRRAAELQTADSQLLSFGNFEIDQANRTVSIAEEAIELAGGEFDLLWALARHSGTILSRDELAQELRGAGFDGLDRTIDAKVSRLRRHLNSHPNCQIQIKTVRNKGYLLTGANAG
ncbi:response regulator [Dongshaea marina]|uniref:response regulator n=1 Tax=Dongshaea marina TaxID=2047966 RepID=UPI000D3E294C|nr:response regulator [Dongshaea marina]